jgi:hypothetical protein
MSDHLPVILDLKVDQTNGINEISAFSSINVAFKNPVNENINITIQLSERGKLDFKILNLLGQQLFSKEVETSGNLANCTLPLDNINNGIYLLQITDSKNNKIVKKFVKE